MKRIWLTLLFGVATNITTFHVPAATAASPVEFAMPQQADQALVIRDVKTHGDVVSGVLVNPSSEVVRNVRLMVRHAWLWNNERHPGANSLGRAAFYTVPGPIPPGTSIPFTYQEPLPARPDGHFRSTVEIVEFTEAASTAASR